MNKYIIVPSVLLIMLALSGCTQEEVSPNNAQQTQQKALGYVETLATVNEESRENIKEAVSKENAKLEEAKKALEEEMLQEDVKDNNLQNQSNMNDVPKEIDMTLAQTCKSAVIKTNKGDITVEFDANKAPIAVANFCTLAKKGFYDGVIFHRVIKDFMIQGGDPTGTGTGGPGYKFKDELPESGEYKVGSIAMANSGPNTNGSQFFIVTGGSGVGLPPSYTLFGQVVDGMDTVNTIQEVETTTSPTSGEKSKPVEDIIIESVDIETE